MAKVCRGQDVKRAALLKRQSVIYQMKASTLIRRETFCDLNDLLETTICLKDLKIGGKYKGPKKKGKQRRPSLAYL
jgi:hypothetical protein